MTIAGSDSGGCAGIQADLRTFAALGVHGTSAITAVTAQNTKRVTRVFPLPPEVVEAQIEAVVEDIALGAVKTGMLASAPIVRAVVRQVERRQLPRLVVDPVMISTGGDPLLDPDAVDILRSELLPLARVVTPNLKEAEILANVQIVSQESLAAAAERILQQGPRAVLIKGGHLENPAASIDYLFEAGRSIPYPAPRVPTNHTHGSGCTLAAAICAFLACGLDLDRSVAAAKSYVSQAITDSYPVGQGNGPLGHLGEWWKILDR